VNDQQHSPAFGRGPSRQDGTIITMPQRDAAAALGIAPNIQEAVAKPSRRSRHARNRFVVIGHFLLTLAVLGTVAAAGATYFGKAMFEQKGPLAADTIFVVERNANLRGIAGQLKSAGIVSNEHIFHYGVRLNGNTGNLKAGEYKLAAGASMRDVMDAIVSGRSVQYAVTIPEGLTVEQAWERIASNESLTGEMPAALPAEGMLIADTYNFPRGSSRENVVARMQELQKALVEDIWEKRAPDLPIKDVNEFVTLASIVEKETAIAEERPRVAAVFINRLRQGMRLQSDPTIIYGIFGGAGKPADRPIYKSDIEKPTPYNTYTIDGLPPGPIAIPGRAALEAVANPITTKDLFFVADGTGGHVFAETYDEHNANVIAWRKIEAERAKAAKAEAAAEAAAANEKPAGDQAEGASGKSDRNSGGQSN
jgi:UPF0755 protein